MEKKKKKKLEKQLTFGVKNSKTRKLNKENVQLKYSTPRTSNIQNGYPA